MALVITLFALFASLFTLSKTALDFSEPFFLIGSRMTFAGIILLSYQFLCHRKNFKFSLAHIIPFLLLGVLAIYVTNIAEIWGIQYMASAKACLIYSLSPFLASLVAYFVLKETLSKKKWFGLLVGFLGLIPILFAHTSAADLAKNLIIISWPEAALLTAVFSSVYGWILLKKIINQYKYSPIMANGISMLLGGTLALLHSYLSGENWGPFPIISKNYTAFIELTLWMTLISNVICYNLYGHLLKKYSATFMALAGLVTPLFASLFGWYFLNEVITWHFFISMLIFSIGLLLFYQEEIGTSNLVTPSSQ